MSESVRMHKEIDMELLPNAAEWIGLLKTKLLEEFSERLLFVGLQGSYRRGEATEKSDIDVMVVLDELCFDDLQAYKRIVEKMPHAEKACGFICGRQDLLCWPKYELFQLKQETDGYLGNLEELLPPLSENDIRDSIKNSAAGMYHDICHRFLYGGPRKQAEELKDAYKSAFFILQLAHFIHTGEYIGTKRELSERLIGDNAKVLNIGMHWEALRPDREQNPDAYYKILIHWSGSLLRDSCL